MRNKAVFLDRDGTINLDPGYLGDPALVKLFPGVAEGLSKLKNEFDFRLVVVSNQSGITRGYITEQDVDAVNKRINEILAPADAEIDEFIYCPYHPDFDSPERTVCRKPSPKMVLDAAEKMDIDLKDSFLVGDSAADIQCGINAGVKTILLDYYYRGDQINILKKEGKLPNFIAHDFLEACNYICDQIYGGH